MAFVDLHGKPRLLQPPPPRLDDPDQPSPTVCGLPTHPGRVSTAGAADAGNLAARADLPEIRDREERRQWRPASPPSPSPARTAAGKRVPRPYLFQRRHQQPPPLGRVLLAEKLVRQLLRLHGARGAPRGGRRGGGSRRGEGPQPVHGPAPSGRRAARLALARSLGGEARGRTPTRHARRSPRANATRRRRRRHPAPPPRGRPPAPPRAALRRGCAPRHGLARRETARGWTLRPVAPARQRGTQARGPERDEAGAGVGGERGGPEVAAGESGRLAVAAAAATAAAAAAAAGVAPELPTSKLNLLATEHAPLARAGSLRVFRLPADEEGCAPEAGEGTRRGGAEGP